MTTHGAADYLHCKKCGNVEYSIEQSYGKYVCDKCLGPESVAKDRKRAEEYIHRKRAALGDAGAQGGEG